MPLFSQVHTNASLANLTLARPIQSYIANDLFPILPVQKKSDVYYLLDDEKEYARITDDAISPGGIARRVDAGYETATYTTGGHGLADTISAEDIANADNPLDLVADSVQRLVQKVSINKEVLAKVSLDAALTGAKTAAASNGWNQTAGTPIEDILAGIQAIETAGGVRPNVMAMDSISWNDLRNHADIVARVVSSGSITGDNPAEITTRGVAQLFGLDRVAVTSAVKNTGISGQSETNARVWSDDVYIGFAPQNPGIKSYPVGIQFTWRGAPGTASNGFRVRTWFDNDTESDVVEVKAYYDLKVTAGTAGYRISNVSQ